MKKVLRAFEARDINAGGCALIKAGALLVACRIVRSHAPGCEPYEMEFDCAGRRFAVPLFVFQPRTESAIAVADPAEERVAG